VELLLECYNAPSDLRSLIRSVAYLIRGAIFRQQGLGWVVNKVCLLSELIDMYHTHEATKRHDKVYALLGMSSDEFSDTSLWPDYRVSWKDLFETLTKHVLCKELSVAVLLEEECAVIRGEGYILGSISRRAEATQNGRQNMIVAWRRICSTAMTTNSLWNLHPSAKQVMIGDVVCLFHGASKPTIVRFYGDHWAIIIIAATPPQTIRAKDEDVEWRRYLQGVETFQIRKLQCCWDWGNSPWKSTDREERKATGISLDQVTETWNSALVLGDTEEYEKAERKFQEAMDYYEMASRERCVIESLADLLSFTDRVDLDLMNKRYRQPPLLWAAEKGYDAVVGLIIGNLNANVDFKDKFGRTAILCAATNGHLAVVKRLLQERADVNAAAARYKAGKTALQAASGGGHLAVVLRLLQGKADVNAAAADGGRTALQAAAEGGHLAVVERLLQERADVNAAAAADGGRTALQAAAGGGHLPVVERLLQEKADVNAAAAYDGGRTALQAAAEGGHLAVVERLLQEKADINAAAAKDGGGRTALQAAAGGGHLAVVERLLQERADVDAAASQFCGRTALQAAAEGGHVAVVERLLQEKADVNAAAAYYGHGRTALQAAAGGGHVAVVERLLQERADVHAVAAYRHGRTALQAAAGGGHLAVVERLLQEKADVMACRGYYGR
jgi:ankyrin repeat protein